jgi:outer membrane protein assembly factor BamD
LIDLYPFSVYVSKAELGIADAYFNKKRYDEAIPSYKDFLERHPTNEQVPHVIYHLGMCYYEKKMSIDRDQLATYESEANFRLLVTSHPKSEYYSKAKQRLEEVRDDLAKRERYIGKFYFREKEYYAALRRYQRLIRNYPDTKYFEESLYYLARCYFELGEAADAKKQISLLKTKFPNGRYAKKADKLLEKLN